MRSLSDMCRGVYRQHWKVVQHTFTAFSVIFTVVKVITHFLPAIKIEGPLPLSAAAFISVIFGLIKVWKPSRIELYVPNCNTIIEVVFGDLFDQNGIRAIGVSQFFDSKLGRPVSPKSLHGIFLQKCFGGGTETFDKQVGEDLKKVTSCTISKVEGKTQAYQIGTTALACFMHERVRNQAFWSLCWR
jgi:hypothetical protein